MTTALIVRQAEGINYRLAPLPEPTPKATGSLSTQDYARHVAQQAAAIKATLRQYFVPAEDEVIAQYELDDWMAAVEDWPVDELRAALRGWVIDNPRRRPNYGDILGRLKAQRGHAWAAQRPKPALPDPDRQPCSKEAAAEILAQANLAGIKRFGGAA